MGLESREFVHVDHMPYFAAAAKMFHCQILVRKTGHWSLSWVGRCGYTGKRADMKGKTSDQNVGQYLSAGLVCSPELRPNAFTPERLASAREEWAHSKHLVTVPDARGFSDDRPARGCRTPYILQTNPDHKHYGCVALTDMGLLTPRYVHGDYDLYAIVPEGSAHLATNTPITESHLGSTMKPSGMGLEEQLKLQVKNLEGPLSFRVANYINVKIAGSSPDLLGSLMVNHGEQVNLGPKGIKDEPVLAFLSKKVDGEWTRVLNTLQEQVLFFRRKEFS
ncbi:MAG TPA: hypothetical protein VFJ87_12605 [Rhodanobacteraceae bacterium]|nr:hypothetical protein [Rhodanobacteraceae bacterium]